MSMLGAHKAQITKAAKTLRKKIADFDEAILEPVDITTKAEVTLVPWDQYNYPIELELWTRETITTVPRTNTQNDSDIVDYEDRVEVDVLIGIDNYWRVVDLHKNEKLPSGLTLSHTRFRPVLSGLKYPVVYNNLLASKTLFTDNEPISDHLVRSLLGLDTVAIEEHENAEDA
ncbi:unnamed protein product [Cylicocyclus nassatus]|uniref:Uncharacterized protein n=1 Tax=Cylicocyclus nassatus TaxID=53992 RepID=A0AA36DUH9_CYLNA|nr:unnamed protein product [Cylicocyclus nassatus]